MPDQSNTGVYVDIAVLKKEVETLNRVQSRMDETAEELKRILPEVLSTLRSLQEKSERQDIDISNLIVSVRKDIENITVKLDPTINLKLDIVKIQEEVSGLKKDVNEMKKELKDISRLKYIITGIAVASSTFISLISKFIIGT